ncbi:MAG: N-acetylmuramoyl-L-alanine amidase [Gemmatimonadaceae bacterium]|nr:N-acetylmuramoyl-L-alanine amidase [Gemmatimonadaceae bacterium]
MVAAALAACRAAGPGSGAPGTPTPRPAPIIPRPTGPVPQLAGLPAIPEVRGAPIVPKVEYPDSNQLITSRDSNFVLGRVGSGDVALTINGSPVTVAPNGAFIAFLANPPASQPQYTLVASRGADTVRKVVPVRYARRTALPATGKLHVDSASLSPVRGWWARANDLVRVSVRAPRNATVWLVSRDSVKRPMLVGLGTAVARPPEVSVPDTADYSATFATEIAAHVLGDSAKPARVLVARGADTVRLAVPFVRALHSESRLLGMLRTTSTIGSDTDQVVNARTIPDGTYKWLLLPGTVLEVAGRQQGYTRLVLDGAVDAWVANGDVTILPDGAAMPRRVTGGLRVTPSKEWVDLSIPMGDKPAHLVEADGRTMVLTLYGVQANPEISPIIGNDTLIRRIAWEQVTSDRVRLMLTLSQPAYGWLSLWDEARRAFVLRVRRLPVINAQRPLQGLTIAVDPGHPPAGATGPTGLYEGDAVFPVGQKVVEKLTARGAIAFSTRPSLAPLGLTERGVIARRRDAHAFVSIHLNALPDGVNPFTANGTSTLFFHNASEPLARVLEEELVKRFGLRDLGVHYQNLAVARPSWYPSALTEGLFVMMPEQEAAMRDPGFQDKYADAIVAGLERYFRGLMR